MSNRIVSACPEGRRLAPLRRSTFRYPARPECVKDARRWLDRRMSMAGVPGDSSSTALLLLSELVTNCVTHQEAGFIVVRAHLCVGGLRTEVRDDSGQLPDLCAPSPSPDSESGRGLWLVDALATRWGRFESNRGPGVFFALTWER
ncbi:ATP-binding protein [Nocardiopsis metallicus]|uniref:Anti-sigma regulatory factor (Ser/Thr protein kinase) n=1 Tax=Nocardiopsis metallicus TaxID=179819 RepID=A0A840WI61_9ACTN|nr:ATP-binding protein [Nocardiopsis metallicus]MBB5492691.1 anti-sigma regulatory factor (Ser/Thr protein kinase) [Nocardiopsis metallicus]